ncbi:MAG: hypothetical protein JO340_03895 [Acidobacteriaceae bacterium]|nr:hypothetical protein [Acidobacteriaceae bacterium]
MTVYGIVFLAVALRVASGFESDLGAPACAAGLLVAAMVSLRDRRRPRDISKEIAWSVIPLVAGLFVIVKALNGVGRTARRGGLAARARRTRSGAQSSMRQRR